MFETLSIPVVTMRKGILAITSRILRGSSSAAFLLLFMLAAVGSASAITTLTPATVTVSSATPAYGASVTLTATLTGWVSAAGGTITFTAATSSTGTYTAISTCGTSGAITVAATTTTCAVTTLPVGANYIKATYAPTNTTTYAGATSAAAATVTVLPAVTLTTLNSSGYTITSGVKSGAVVLNAAISPSSSTGTVKFYLTSATGTQFSCSSSTTGVTVTSGVATCSTTLPTTAATSTFVAVFTPTSGTAATGTQSFVVTTGSSTTTTDSTMLTTSTYGAAYALKANVTLSAAPTAAISATTVTFYASSASGTLGSSVGTCTVSFTASQTAASSCTATSTTALPAGLAYVTAVFAGTSTYGQSASAQLAVTNTATLSTTLAASSTAVNQGTSVTLTATTTPAAATSGTVNFKNGGTSISGCSAVTASAGVATCTTSALPVGTNALTAAFTQTANTSAVSNSPTTSNTVNVVVVGAATLSLSAAPYYYGAPVTLNATGYNSAATGTVTFLDGSTSIGTCTLSSGACASTVSVSSLALGSHSITASYAGNGTYPASVTAASTITVVANVTTVALTPTTGSIYLSNASSITLTATITGSGSVAVPSGRVTFYDSTTSLGTVTVSGTPAVATLTITNPGTLTTSGVHYIIASYSGVYSAVGVATFSASLSHATKLTVASTQTISNWYNKSMVYGTPLTLSAVSSSASDTTNGMPVTYSVVSVVPAAGSSLTALGTTVTSGVLTPNGVGTVTVQADIAGNTYYTAATPVTKTFTVYPKALTITASSPSATTYGTAAATITPTYSGWSTTPTDTASSLTTAPTCTTSYTGSTTNHPGTYTTYCYGAVDANYDITYVNGSLTVNKATPVYATSPTAATITYGPLSTSALTGGTATGPFGTAITGHYVWASSSTYPAAGSPSADTPSVNFNPTNTTDYNVLTNATSVSINVTKANPTVTWPTAASVTAGAVVFANTPSVYPALTGGSTTSGVFTWTTEGSVTLTTGANSVSVTYTPNNSSYNTLTHNVTVTGTKTLASCDTDPASTTTCAALISAAAINYGQKLTNSVLTVTGNNTTHSYTVTNGVSGWAGQSGTFTWTTPSTAPAANTGSRAVGAAAYNVTFTPTDTANFSALTGISVPITVNQITPTVSSWPTAAGITFGQVLPSLSGGATTGTFAWTCSLTDCSSTNSGLVAGTNNISVTYTPTNTNYATTTHTVSVYVEKATPTVSTFPTAGTITATDVLSTSVLSTTTGSGTAPYTDAGNSSTVAGGFNWTCAVGTDTCEVVPVGTSAQSVTFTPTDSTDFASVESTANVTVNPCGKQDATNSSFSTALSVYNFSNSGSTVSSPTLDVAAAASDNTTSTGVDVSAICVVPTTDNDGTAITISYPTITSEVSPSSGALVGTPADYAVFGTNAAVLAYGLSTTAGHGATITINDDGSGNAGSIQTMNDYSAGVFATMGGVINISNTYVSTGMGGDGQYAPAFAATKHGALTITNTSSSSGGAVYATTFGNHSPVLTTGLGGGTVHSTGNFYTSSGTNSPGIYAAGAASAITLNGDSISAAASSIIEINGSSSVTITSTTPATLTGALGDGHGILLFYDSTTGDASTGTSAFSQTGGSLTYSCDVTSVADCAPTTPTGRQSALPTLFAVASTTATINLTDVTITNVTPTSTNSFGTLLTAAALPGTSGASTATLTANGVSLIGDVIVDATGTVNLNLNADGSSVPSALTGSINASNVSGGQVNLTLDASSTWVVTGTASYVYSLTNAVPNNSNITCYNSGQCKVYTYSGSAWVALSGVQ